MSRIDVFGVGNALVDMEFAVGDDFLTQNALEKGHMTLVDATRQVELIDKLGAESAAVKRASGGSAANTLAALCAFGGSAYYACRVADDDAGRFFLKDMADAGVRCSEPAPVAADDADTEHHTGRCLIMVTTDAERTMQTHLGISSTLSREQLDMDALSNAGFAYLEGYLCTSDSGRDAVVATRLAAERAGVRTVLTFSDPSMVRYFKDALAEMMGPRVDHLFCNLEEARLWTGEHAVDAVAAALKASAGTFALTLGKDGALVWDGDTLTAVPVVPAHAVDTNGAGDMFAGAYLFGLTRGFDHVEAARLAVRAAARLVTHFGARMPLDAHAEVLAEHRAG